MYSRMYPEHYKGSRSTPGHLKRSQTMLTVYDGDFFLNYGTIEIYITLNDYMTRAIFFVAEIAGTIILGLPSIKQMNIITIKKSRRTI